LAWCFALADRFALQNSHAERCFCVATCKKTAMGFDQDKVEEVVPALLWLTVFEVGKTPGRN